MPRKRDRVATGVDILDALEQDELRTPVGETHRPTGWVPNEAVYQTREERDAEAVCNSFRTDAFGSDLGSALWETRTAFLKHIDEHLRRSRGSEPDALGTWSVRRRAVNELDRKLCVAARKALRLGFGTAPEVGTTAPTPYAMVDPRVVEARRQLAMYQAYLSAHQLPVPSPAQRAAGRPRRRMSALAEAIISAVRGATGGTLTANAVVKAVGSSRKAVLAAIRELEATGALVRESAGLRCGTSSDARAPIHRRKRQKQ